MARTFSGCLTALVTPFDERGNVDEKVLVTLVDRQIEGGIDGLVPCGTTGESPTLSEEEQHRIIELVVGEAGGKIPVLAGAGSNSTRHAVHLAQAAEKAGADGVLSVGPYYNKPTQEGYKIHFRQIAEAIGIPLVIYNIPGRTGGNITPATLVELAETDNIVGVKEASGNLDQTMEILSRRPSGFALLSGEDHLTLPLIALGGEGVISVLSNEVPREFAEMVHWGLKGDFEKARAIHNRLLELSRANFIETSPIPVKTALSLMGLLRPVFRPPLCPMTAANVPVLEGALRRLKLI